MSGLDRAFIKAYGMDELDDDETLSKRSASPSVIPAPHADFFSSATTAAKDADPAAETHPKQIESDTPTTAGEDGLLQDVKLFTLHESHACVPSGKDSVSEAAFSVERFAWPPVCDQLLAVTPELFEQLMGELALADRSALRSIAVTSCRRGEGRTNFVLCLARSAARAGMRTVMVDADIDRPDLARRLGVLPQLGWEDVVAGEVPLTEALIESTEDQLTLFPLTEKAESLLSSSAASRSPSSEPKVEAVSPSPELYLPPNESSQTALPSSGSDSDTLVAEPPAESDARVKLSGLAPVLEELRERFDLVILDCGPVSFNGDPIGMFSSENKSLIDTAVFIEDVRSTCRDEVAAACQRLQTLGIPCAGVVENFVTDSHT